MFSQDPISTANAQSEDHLYCPCLITIALLLPMSSQYTISTDIFKWYPIFTTHVQSPPHLSSPCPNCTSLYGPWPVSNTYLHPMPRQYPISMQCPCPVPRVQSVVHLHSSYPESTQYLKAHAQSIPRLYSKCPVRIPSLLPMFDHNSTSAHVQLVHHLYWPCPVSTLSLLVMSNFKDEAVIIEGFKHTIWNDY